MPLSSASENKYVDAAGFSVVTNKKGLKHKSQKHKSYPNSSCDELLNFNYKAATTQLRPVILQANLGDKGGRPLASYNPITIDRCLGKTIGQYESWKPIRNGNLLIICKTSNQVKTLLDLDSLSDSAGNSIPIIASTTKPPGARGVIYNVPLNITNDELLECLKQFQVNNIKRFKFKDAEGKRTDTKTVLLHFDCPDLPPQVQLGYLKNNVKQYIPMPVRCFKCNRFGHIAEKCRGKERCAKCGKEHNTSSCSITNVIAMKCANCNGNHSAASKICPKYIQEAQVLKYQTEKKLTYAEACWKYNRATNSPRNADAGQSQTLSNLREFSPPPASNGASPINARPYLQQVEKKPAKNDVTQTLR